MRSVWFIVPAGVDDPARPSGGNRYDRRLADELTASGWSVHERPVADSAHLAGAVASVPDGAVLLVDGLIASVADDALVPAAGRLRLVVLLHMPVGGPREAAVLRAGAAVITTSEWTRNRVLARYDLTPDRVRVAKPGTDPAGIAPGTHAGTRLLCVAALTPTKGHDRLLRALATLADRPWRLTCVGSLDRAPDFVHELRSYVEHNDMGGRVHLRGPLVGPALEAAYAAADAAVFASLAETYGMVVTEAIAHGVPVIATAVGGVPEALGATRDGRRPGLLVRPDDDAALAEAIDRWLSAADLRLQLRAAAHDRRPELTSWATTAERVASVLCAVAALEVVP